MPKKIGETKYYETSFGTIPRSQLIPMEVEGIKRAWDFLIDAKENNSIKLDPKFIRQLHRIGFAWIFPDDGGKFRREEVMVSRHTPPKYYQVPPLMENLFLDLKERIKNLPAIEKENYFNRLLELLTWAHHHFLWIHPFKDYNGRIGRLLINIILLYLDLPPIELNVETENTRKAYIKALQKADQGDYQALENIINKGLSDK